MFFVYRFIDKNKSVIYVGKSKQDLQRRFAAHLHLPDECYRMVKKIEYIECPTEADMSIKEIYYINKYKNNPICFNVLDVTDLPTSIEFNDKWKMYKNALPEHFINSINVKKGYSSEEKIRYNNDGSISKWKSNKQKGVSSFVDALTTHEIDLIVNYFINQINTAENSNQEQIRFRNLVMFVVSTNLPIKTSEFLTLKYSDLFDGKDEPKSYCLQFGRYNKDERIYIPLRKVVKDVLLSYSRRYGLSYANNMDDHLWTSRKHQIMTVTSWGRMLKDAAEAVGIVKNVGAESIRKTYGLNVFQNSFDQLNALVFLGDLWGNTRESQIIKYLSLTDIEVDFDYYLGETFSLCTVDLSKIKCLKTPIYYACNTLSTNQGAVDSRKNKRNKSVWSKAEKIEVVNKYREYGTFKAVAELYGMDSMLVSRWVKEYQKLGEVAFEEQH